MKRSKETVNHPDHYGGADNPYEAIKIIDALNLNFYIGNILKYLLRAPYKGKPVEDLKKAHWYLVRYIKQLEDQENAKT